MISSSFDALNGFVDIPRAPNPSLTSFLSRFILPHGGWRGESERKCALGRRSRKAVSYKLMAFDCIAYKGNIVRAKNRYFSAEQLQAFSHSNEGKQYRELS